MLTGDIKYIEEKNGDLVFPITHVNAVRDSDGTALPQLMDRKYPVDSKTAAQNGTDLSLVSTGEKYTWNNKQDTIDDLTTIRSGAALGATSIQSH